MARRALRSFSEGGLKATESSAFVLEMSRARGRVELHLAWEGALLGLPTEM